MNTLTAEQTKDKERIEKWLKDLLQDKFDLFDWIGEYDPEISYLEQKSILREKVKTFLDVDIKEGAKYCKVQAEKLLDEQIKKAEAEVEAYNKSVTFNDNEDIDKYYSQIHRAIGKVCKGQSNLVLLAGSGGIGKSVSIKRTLTKCNAEYIEFTGDVTEAILFRLLYENNGKIIWFRDNASKLFSGSTATIILKAATETEDARTITKSNYSKQQEDLPDRFLCTCRFIFDFNTVTNIVREDFEALTSRGDYIHFALSEEDIKSIMFGIAKTKEEKEVTRYIVDKFKSTGIVRLNLRTQYKAFQTYKYCIEEGLDWQQELDEELTKRISKDRALLYTLIGVKAVRRTELKKLLIQNDICSSIRTSEMFIQKQIFCGELFETSADERNGFVCINEVIQ